MVTTTRRVRSFPDFDSNATIDGPTNTPLSALGEFVDKTKDASRRWARAPLSARIKLASDMQAGYLSVAEASVRAGCSAKGLQFESPASGEEWITGPWCVVRQLRLVRESLESINKTGNTRIGAIRQDVNGSNTVKVFPYNTIDGILFQGCRADIHIQAGKSREDIKNNRARFYRQTPHDGRLCVILGAGNIAAIPAMDVITKLFNEGTACILKMNPVNAYLGPFIEKAFQQAIAEGYLQIVYGSADVGDYLVRHPDVDEVHITGSDKTHDNIVWGPAGPDRDARFEANTPLLQKPIYSELGNISPVLVVPGPYKRAQLQYQADDVAGYLSMNASFLCNAAKMMVTPKGWQGGKQFMQLLENSIAKLAPRQAYYPGASDRWHQITASHDEVKCFGDEKTGALPWALVTDLDSTDLEESMFREEAFCSVLGQTSVGSADPIEFLDAAVNFCNTRLWGTLSATIIVHPATMKDPVTGPAVERAIARLGYGTVALNTFPGMAFALGTPAWGGYGQPDLRDIQSGRGFVHNTTMLEDIEKTVIRFPLTMFPRAPYHPGHKTVNKMAQRLIALDKNMSWHKLPPVVLNAMRG